MTLRARLAIGLLDRLGTLRALVLVHRLGVRFLGLSGRVRRWGRHVGRGVGIFPEENRRGR